MSPKKFANDGVDVPESIEEIRENINNTFDESDRKLEVRIFEPGFREKVLKTFDYAIEQIKDGQNRFQFLSLEDEVGLDLGDRSNVLTIISYLSNSQVDLWDIKLAYENEKGQEVRLPPRKIRKFLGKEEAEIAGKIVKTENVLMWLEATDSIIRLIYKEESYE